MAKQASPKLNPAAVAVADAAMLLSTTGRCNVTAEMLTADIKAGAPTNADGTINLLHYAAWLTRDRTPQGAAAH